MNGTARADSDRPRRRPVRWAWLGLAPYAQVLSLQEEIREGILRGAGQETLLLVEHPPVITLGRNANPTNVLVPPSLLREREVQVVSVSRGGDATFHGPGQLVGYPVFRMCDGVRSHVATMGKAIITLLGELGIVARWRDDHPGVWLGDQKICAVGIHVRRGVAIHGFALNVNIDLGGFADIVPCGLRGFGVTSVAKHLGFSPPMDEVVKRAVRAFEQCFGIQMERIVPADSRLQIANGNR
jgi:lipoyl(octanoyl) transferase